MKTLVGLEAVVALDSATAVTIGTFDGVHLGHRALVARTMAHAAEHGLVSAVVTWDRHPAATLRPDKVPPLLTTPERKIELLEDLGVELVFVLPFDDELSHWPPERFAKEVLANGLGARAVFVGEGWRFGHKAAGDVALLTQLGDELGFTVDGAPLVEIEGDAVSSSRARSAVAQGDMKLARALLGRPFDFDGTVVRGADRGADLGYPTANMRPDPTLASPPQGVYAGRAAVDSSRYAAAINVGVSPTFGGDPDTTPVTVEAYLLDFSGDLYGRTLRIEYLERLRDEVKFDSVGELVAQMDLDVASARAVAGGP